jgi:hypothetical protein
MAMDANNLMGAAKDLGTYILIFFGTYFTAMLVHIVLGYFTETVIPALGLNATGTAVTAIETLTTGVGTAITAVVAIVAVILGLLTLVVVLRVFGFKLNFGMGGRV